MTESPLRHIPAAKLDDALRRTPLDQFVVWTGTPASGRSGSLRARAFACVEIPRVPVSLRALLQRAARLDGMNGLDPDVVRSAVRQHQGAKPAVLLLVQRGACGGFFTVTDVQHAGALGRRMRAGEALDLQLFAGERVAA